MTITARLGQRIDIGGVTIWIEKRSANQFLLNVAAAPEIGVTRTEEYGVDRLSRDEYRLRQEEKIMTENACREIPRPYNNRAGEETVPSSVTAAGPGGDGRPPVFIRKRGEERFIAPVAQRSEQSDVPGQGRMDVGSTPTGGAD